MLRIRRWAAPVATATYDSNRQVAAMPSGNPLDRLFVQSKWALQSFPMRFRARGEGYSPHRVIFLSGVQRSGTELCMDLLDLSFHTGVYHESDARAFEDYRLRSLPVLQDLIRRSSAPTVVFKCLLDNDLLSDLMASIPNSKTIWVFRHYGDMINSFVRSWPEGRARIDDIVKDRNAGGWRGRGMTDATHELLKRVYRVDLANADGIALFWYYRNQLLFDQELDSDERVLLLQYDALVQEPKAYIEEIEAFCGIRILSYAASRVYKSSVRKEDSPRIAPEIKALCDDMLMRLQDSARSARGRGTGRRPAYQQSA
jgi:hypothetical protein